MPTGWVGDPAFRPKFSLAEAHSPISLSPPTPSQSPACYLADPAKLPACLSVLGSLITNNPYFLPPSVGLSVPDATHIIH